MADNTNTKLYSILSSLYQGEVKLKQNDLGILTGVIGYSALSAGVTSGTIDSRLKTLEEGTSAASGKLSIAGHDFYANNTTDVDVPSADIISSVITPLATDATGLAGAKAVYDNDMFLSGKIDDIASSFITGAIDPDDGVLSLGKNGQNISGAIAVDGTTVIKGANGLATALKLKEFTPNSTAYTKTYKLVDANNNAIDGSAEINIPKDQLLKNASYLSGTEQLLLEFYGPSGDILSSYIDVKDMVHEYEGSNAITVADTLDGKSAISLKLDNTGEDFLSITSNGLLLSGVQDAIDAAVSGANNDVSNLSGKLSAAIDDGTAGKVVTTLSSGITASTYTLGGATLDASPAATVLATEAAVTAAVAAEDAKLSGAYTNNKVVLGNNGEGLKASAYEIGGDVALETTPSADKLATEKALYAQYEKIVDTDLEALESTIAGFNASL